MEEIGQRKVTNEEKEDTERKKKVHILTTITVIQRRNIVLKWELLFFSFNYSSQQNQIASAAYRKILERRRRSW